MKLLHSSKLYKLSSILLVFAILCSLTLTALADTFDENRKASLIINVTIEKKPMEDVTYNIYKVADCKGFNTFVMTEEYAAYNITLPDMTSTTEMEAFTETLVGYIARDNSTPQATAKSGKDGNLGFSNLDLGVYLAVGEAFSRDGYINTLVPFIVFFPFGSEEDGSPCYDAKLDAKHARIPETVAPVFRHVVKHWEDAGYIANRPISIEVDLLCDGAIYDTVTLNAENDWRYTWSTLEAGHEWSFVERTIGGRYTTSSSTEGITTVITNTYNPPPPPTTPEDPPPPPPPPPDTPDSPPPIVPENPPPKDLPPFQNPENPTIYMPDTPPPLAEIDIPDPEPEPTPESPKKIPQTGQLQWPICVMVGTGLFCIATGVLIKKKKPN